MESRYSYMKPSAYLDDDGDYFPDPSSVNYNDIVASNIKPVEMTELTCEKFWTILPVIYGAYEWDDVLLSLNRVPHRNMLKPGDVIFAPTVADIRSGLNGS